ncbi:sugar phosphate isomerase/epimerase family protein [Plantibacter flavus]|uniref:sugar phosphate isomerase/epimerase family protein n=1 Tax=Plantibacter flavus TaxID=150123 RepID=UPI003F5CD13F
MSTSCVYPLDTRRAFELAAEAGYDGVEVMVTQDRVTQDPEALLALAAETGLDILSIHAPVLTRTAFVWGRDHREKLRRSVELAATVGASTVVVHPPFRWQRRYAKAFVDLVAELTERHGLEIAVENMACFSSRGIRVQPFAFGYDPGPLDCAALTLDFSHAALAGEDSLEIATRYGDRLRHVHLCDGTAPSPRGAFLDEHLLPGAGEQPVTEVLELLRAAEWSGSIVAEVHLPSSGGDTLRLAQLRASLAFAKRALDTTSEPSKESPDAGDRPYRLA